MQKYIDKLNNKIKNSDVLIHCFNIKFFEQLFSYCLKTLEFNIKKDKGISLSVMANDAKQTYNILYGDCFVIPHFEKNNEYLQHMKNNSFLSLKRLTRINLEKIHKDDVLNKIKEECKFCLDDQGEIDFVKLKDDTNNFRSPNNKPWSPLYIEPYCIDTILKQAEIDSFFIHKTNTFNTDENKTINVNFSKYLSIFNKKVGLSSFLKKNDFLQLNYNNTCNELYIKPFHKDAKIECEIGFNCDLKPYEQLEDKIQVFKNLLNKLDKIQYPIKKVIIYFNNKFFDIQTFIKQDIIPDNIRQEVESSIQKQQQKEEQIKKETNRIINLLLNKDNLHKRKIAFSSPKNLSDFVCDKKIR